jgi:hypothetical protein
VRGTLPSRTVISQDWSPAEIRHGAVLVSGETSMIVKASARRWGTGVASTHGGDPEKGAPRVPHRDQWFGQGLMTLADSRRPGEKLQNLNFSVPDARSVSVQSWLIQAVSCNGLMTRHPPRPWVSQSPSVGVSPGDLLSDELRSRETLAETAPQGVHRRLDPLRGFVATRPLTSRMTGFQGDPANTHLLVVVCVEAEAERNASRWEGSGNQ